MECILKLTEERKDEIRRNLLKSSPEKERSHLKAGVYNTNPEFKNLVLEYLSTHERIEDSERKDESLALMRQATQLAKDANELSARANTRSLIALVISVSMLLIAALSYLVTLG